MGVHRTPLTSRTVHRGRSSCPGHALRPTHTLGIYSFTCSVFTECGLPRGCWEQVGTEQSGSCSGSVLGPLGVDGCQGDLRGRCGLGRTLGFCLSIYEPGSGPTLWALHVGARLPDTFLQWRGGPCARGRWEHTSSHYLTGRMTSVSG